jgi:hypothetical protein
MLSVPYFCGPYCATMNDGSAYMRAPGEAAPGITSVLGSVRSASSAKRRPRVGIVWAGSATHGNDHNRSLPMSHLAALIGGADVEWVSLQLGSRGADIAQLDAPVRRRVLDATPLIEDFGDTAHILARCDMLVTVDTAVAHLAGALGVSTLVMLPYVPDWRWQLARKDTPWYQSVRLVRQPMAGAWEHVIEEVHRAISSGAT